MFTVKFTFVRDNEIQTETNDFDELGICDSDIQDYADDLVDELNEDLGDSDDEWALDDWEVIDFDDDYGDPSDFTDLDAYGEFCNMVDTHGEAYKLRHEDIGDYANMDYYYGCWESFEKFAENYVDDCMDLDETARHYFDIKQFASDLEMDYSVYEGDDGYHVFLDT